MKTNNIFKGLCLALAACASLAVTSCKDEPDAYEIQGGKPTINFIRPVSVEAKDSIITAASMRSTVCVVGENLRSVTALFFNDQPAVLNTSYMTDHTLIVTVPNEIPDLVTDKIYFVTQSKDTVAYDFHVIIPAPVVSSMSNEWAAAGEEVTIVGDYFLDYEEATTSSTTRNSRSRSTSATMCCRARPSRALRRIASRSSCLRAFLTKR